MYFRGTHLGNTWFMVYLKDIYSLGILLPKKVPKRKTCQILRKRVIFDYLLLNCINYSEKIRNFEFNNNKNDLHHDKEHKKLHIRHLSRFFYFSNGFRLIRCQTPIFKLEPSFYCAILVQSSHLNNSKTIRIIEKLFKCLICSFLCSLS